MKNVGTLQSWWRRCRMRARSLRGLADLALPAADIVLSELIESRRFFCTTPSLLLLEVGLLLLELASCRSVSYSRRRRACIASSRACIASSRAFSTEYSRAMSE